MKKVFSIAGFAAGIITILVGLYIAFGFKVEYEIGTFPDGYSFGADFYTEIYSAARQCAIDLMYLGRFMEEFASFLFKAIGFFMIAFGAGATCFFGTKLDEMGVFAGSAKTAKELEEKADEPTPEVSAKEETAEEPEDTLEEEATEEPEDAPEEEAAEEPEDAPEEPEVDAEEKPED